MFKITLWLCLAVSATCSRPKLVTILLDGFRWDYLDRLGPEEVPNFSSFITDGVKADYVQPIYPSISFPSWTTIATGLYPESHGIMGNYMFDEETGQEFDMNLVALDGDNTNNPIWWQSHKPIWISATEAGLKTSLYLWSRCDVEFNGVRPAKCTHYDNVNVLDIELFARNLNESVQDLQQGFNASFIYYCNVDQIGHIDGPDSPKIAEEIQRVDALLGSFMKQLSDGDIEANIVIVSDHGMTDVSSSPFTPLTRFTNPDNILKIVDRGAFSYVAVKDKSLIDQVASDLGQWQGVEVLKREDIPDYLHVSKSKFALDLLVKTKGTELVDSEQLNQDPYLPKASPNIDVGLHGWDDSSLEENGYLEGGHPDMRGIFLAKGPGFKPNHSHPWIKLVDEYQILMKLLTIPSEPHNGTWERVSDMFNSSTISKASVPLVLASFLLLRLAK